MKDRLNNGVLIGTMLSEVANPNMLRVFRAAGFAFVIVDCEHGYFSLPQVAGLAAVANGMSFPLIVRIPGVERECILKYLDSGVDGILIPMMDTAETMRSAVAFAKYQPLGKRGISVTRAHSEYTPGPLAGYLERSNRRTMVFAQIETAEGVANAGEIAGVDGLDGLFIGPNDLAADLGSLGRFDTDEVVMAMNRVIAACRAAGKPTGCISSDTGFLRRCMDMGMTLVSCNSEVGMVLKAGKGIVGDLTLDSPR